jgi:hypothetical protein
VSTPEEQEAERQRHRELEEALDERYGNVPCPVCQNAEWTGWDRFALLPLGLHHGETGRLGQNYTTLWRSCTVCGFIRSHLVQTFMGRVQQDQQR